MEFTIPKQRNSYEKHGKYGWVIGLAMDHYRCLSVYLPNTNATIIVDTFHWSEYNYFKLPKITNEE